MSGRTAVVVGAGPVGLTLALGLSRAGIGTVVLEKSDRETAVTWKGSTIHPPTLELLDQLGLATAMVGAGLVIDRLQYRDSELNEYAELDFSLLREHTAFPFRFQFEQYKLLDLLRSACDADSGVDVRYRSQVVRIDEADSGAPAAVVLHQDSGEQYIERADVLVGADGAHSGVRNALGIDFDGITYPERNAVLATDYDLTQVAHDLGPVSYWTSPQGKLSLIRTPDHWRIAMALPGSTAAEDPARFGRSRLHGMFGLPLDLTLNQAATYRIHQRVAATLHADRICLIGDAAHINSPTGGLGLNSGIHDAFDLVARLSAAARLEGAVAEYSQVRSRVARLVVQQISGQNTAMAATRERESREQTIRQLRVISSDRSQSTDYLLRVSMIEAARAYPPGTLNVPVDSATGDSQ